MTKSTAKFRLLGTLFLLLGTLGAAAFAEDFQAQQPIRSDAFDARWNWAAPVSWKNAENQNAVPSTAGDVGIVSDGHRTAVRAPLGADGNRPTIRVEKGGRITLSQDMVNPLIVDGGVASGAWMGKSLSGPLTVTADSTFHARDDDGIELRIDGTVTNTKPVTLHLDGGMEWRSNSGKTCTGNIAIDRGQVFVSGPLGTGQFGTGQIFLAALTRLVVRFPVGRQLYALNNDVSGAGAIEPGNGDRTFTLVDYGKTIEPGSPSQPGTLVIEGSLIFERNTAGQPAKLAIDVQGDGSTPATDYSQLAVIGDLADSLNNVDLVLRLAPNMSAEQAARLRLIVLSAANADEMTKANFHPFHSVLVRCGEKKGSATVNIRHDPLSDLGIVEVSDITLK